MKIFSVYQITFQGKAQADAKAEHTNVCEHFKEALNVAMER